MGFPNMRWSCGERRSWDVEVGKGADVPGIQKQQMPQHMVVIFVSWSGCGRMNAVEPHCVWAVNCEEGIQNSHLVGRQQSALGRIGLPPSCIWRIGSDLEVVEREGMSMECRAIWSSQILNLKLESGCGRMDVLSTNDFPHHHCLPL